MLPSFESVWIYRAVELSIPVTQKRYNFILYFLSRAIQFHSPPVSLTTYNANWAGSVSTLYFSSIIAMTSCVGRRLVTKADMDEPLGGVKTDVSRSYQ